MKTKQRLSRRKKKLFKKYYGKYYLISYKTCRRSSEIMSSRNNSGVSIVEQLQPLQKLLEILNYKNFCDKQRAKKR